MGLDWDYLRDKDQENTASPFLHFDKMKCLLSPLEELQGDPSFGSDVLWLTYGSKRKIQILKPNAIFRPYPPVYIKFIRQTIWSIEMSGRINWVKPDSATKSRMKGHMKLTRLE